MSEFRLVYDNIIFSLQRAGGVSVYWSELLNRANLQYREFVYYGAGRDRDNIFFRKLAIPPEKSRLLPISFSRYLPQFTSTRLPTVFHSSYYRYSVSRNVRNITTVHDFTYELYEKGLKRSVHATQKRLAINNSAGIICVSENTKRDLLRFHPNINPNLVTVIYNGVSDVFRPLSLNAQAPKMFVQDGIDNINFVLFVGDRANYKNFDAVVDFLALNLEVDLVVVGGQEFSKSELIKINRFKHRVFHYRGITEDELNYLYNKAHCLIYPSAYEGFGIPIAEAMKAGCPVIASNSSSIPEVAGGAALLLDEVSPQSIYELVSKLDGTDQRFECINKGYSQAKKFSWDRCFEETGNFYKKMLYS